MSKLKKVVIIKREIKKSKKMLDIKNYSGPTTTASSAIEGRLKVGVIQNKKKKRLKKILKGKYEKK